MKFGDVDRVRKTGRRVPFRLPRQGTSVHADVSGNLSFYDPIFETMFNDGTLVACEVFIRHDGKGEGNRCANADDLTPS